MGFHCELSPHSGRLPPQWWGGLEHSWLPLCGSSASPLPRWGTATREGQGGERKEPGIPHPHPLPRGLLFLAQTMVKQPDSSAEFFLSLLSLVQELPGTWKCQEAVSKRERSQGKGPLKPHVSSATSEQEKISPLRTDLFLSFGVRTSHVVITVTYQQRGFM